jgi:hypothetical protein
MTFYGHKIPQNTRLLSKNVTITLICCFGIEICQKFLDKNFSEKFSAKMEIHKIDTWSRFDESVSVRIYVQNLIRV